VKYQTRTGTARLIGKSSLKIVHYKYSKCNIINIPKSVAIMQSKMLLTIIDVTWNLNEGYLDREQRNWCNDGRIKF
jgi:hypothetical protein